MTERSSYWPTDGTGDGPIDGYSAAALAERERSGLIAIGAGRFGGVFAGFLGELEITGTLSPVSVASGAGHVYGYRYTNDSPVAIDIPTPVSQVRNDRIGLVADWETRTVRLVLAMGVEGGANGSTPGTPGDKYGISLARIEVAPSGAITVHDERNWITTVGYGTIDTSRLADLAVTTAKLAALAVTDAKLASNAVTNAKIANSAVGTNKIADGAVTTAKIDSGAVTFAQLANNSVPTSRIVDGAVTEGKIANLAVTTDKINNLAVTTGKINNLAVTTGKLANLAVTEGKIADGAVTTDKINNLAVTAAKLANLAVTTARLDDLAVTTGKLANLAVTAAKLADDAVTAAKLADNAVTRAKLHPTSFMPTLSVSNVNTITLAAVTPTIMPMGTTVVSGYADGALTAHANGITVNVAGLYLITANVTVRHINVSPDLFRLRIYTDSALLLESHQKTGYLPGESLATFWAIAQTVVAPLAAGSLLALYGNRTADADLTVQPGGARLTALLIAQT